MEIQIIILFLQPLLRVYYYHQKSFILCAVSWMMLKSNYLVSSCDLWKVKLLPKTRWKNHNLFGVGKVFLYKSYNRICQKKSQVSWSEVRATFHCSNLTFRPCSLSNYSSINIAFSFSCTNKWTQHNTSNSKFHPPSKDVLQRFWNKWDKVYKSGLSKLSKVGHITWNSLQAVFHKIP